MKGENILTPLIVHIAAWEGAAVSQRHKTFKKTHMKYKKVTFTMFNVFKNEVIKINNLNHDYMTLLLATAR